MVSTGLYHTGRILIYASGGLLFGLLGRRVYLAGWQQGLSILLGVSILCWIVFKHLSARTSHSPRTPRIPLARLRTPVTTSRIARSIPATFYAWLQSWMSRLWQSPSPRKFLLMGMANGLLPCGMVYMAIAGALTSPTILRAISFMAFFGLGTLPMLLGLQATGRIVSISFRQQIRKALPYLTAVMAILLILRGLNLGIPFISPALAVRPGQVMSCH
jgi:hypothetical protein